MSVVIVSGSAGLIGSEAARFFHQKGFDVVGIDNDMRSYFFGDAASTVWNRALLEQDLSRYTHEDIDIRAESAVDGLFARYGKSIEAIIHTALQIMPANWAEQTARYQEVDMPTLLLWGRHDGVVPLSVGEKLESVLPRARLEVLEECGHLVPEEFPEDSLEIVLDFLS